MNHILIVEDDQTLATGIAMALKSETTHIEVANTLKVASEKRDEQAFDLILLDINLPDGNGLEYLKHVKNTSKSAVILLTANDMELDIVVGLESGADDYITKPFSLGILRARVNARLRQQIVTSSPIYRHGPLVFDFEHLIFTKDQQTIELSKTELKLLSTLIQNKGCTVTRDQLLTRIWDDGMAFVEENALSVAIKRLRDKIEVTPSQPKWIKTIYGIGYRWQEE